MHSIDSRKRLREQLATGSSDINMVMMHKFQLHDQSLPLKKEMGYRWASCGRNGLLNFHWKCMMAPPRIIDYIVVYELCHFYYRNHTDAFWNEVDKVIPDYRERKERLRKYGARLEV